MKIAIRRAGLIFAWGTSVALSIPSCASETGNAPRATKGSAAATNDGATAGIIPGSGTTFSEKLSPDGSTKTKVATWRGKQCKTVTPPKDPPYRHGGTDGGGSGCAVVDSVCSKFEGDVGSDPEHSDYVNLHLDRDGIEAKTYTFVENPSSPHWGAFFGKQFPYLQIVADMWNESISELFVGLDGKLVLDQVKRETREFVGHVENVVLVELVKAPNNGDFAEKPTEESRCLFIERWDFDTRVRTNTPCDNALDCNNAAMLICDYTAKTCQLKQCHDNWPPDDKECPSGQRCWEQNAGWGEASSGVCMPLCSPSEPSSCAAGFSCYPMKSTDFLTPMCIPAGTTPPGAACGGEGLINTGCELGHACAWGTCHKQCDYWGSPTQCNTAAGERCNFLPGVYAGGFCGKPPFDGGGIPHYNSLDPAPVGGACKQKGDQPRDGKGEGTNHGHRCGDDGVAVRGHCDADLTCHKFCRLPLTVEDKALFAKTNGDCPSGQTCEQAFTFDGGRGDFIDFFALGTCH